MFPAMAGAFAFMVSDTLNAYNRFVGENLLERLLIMGAYLSGQFLLVQGYLFFALDIQTSLAIDFDHSLHYCLIPLLWDER